jgi:hypothetical protein
MASWDISAVRIPLNEDCWLGINNAPDAYSGSNYQQAIVTYVGLLNKYNIAAIVDLHWNAPGGIQAESQQPMADVDNAPAFWTSVANTFKSNTSVVFDLYNEPYPDNNQDTTGAWNCLLNGCQQSYYVDANGNNVSYTWQAAGMNELVSAVRSTGATNLIITAGVGWSGLMTHWLDYVPADPLNNLAASTHIYPNGWCSTSSCWNGVLAPITAQYPLVVGEMGEPDCAHSFIDSLMGWLDQQGQNYVAWHWWPTSAVPCSNFPLITDYSSGSPSGYGIGIRDHLLQVNGDRPAAAPPSFSTTANVASATASVGKPDTITVVVNSTIAVSALVDVEVYDTSGNKVAQQTYDNQAFGAGETKSYTYTWPLPASTSHGTYSVKIGVFSPGWGRLYAWNDSAAKVIVG